MKVCMHLKLYFFFIFIKQFFIICEECVEQIIFHYNYG